MILRQCYPYSYSSIRLLAQTGQCRIYSPRLSPSRIFSSTTKSRLDNNASTHYDILKVSPNATQAELKKQFYILSKETHPDVRHDDPKAGDRFAQISESYSVLADPEKRKRYDRDVMRQRGSGPQYGRGGGGGGTYAGSRPATGLSKRRSAFRGPPPSYYTHGNPSANTARQQAQSSQQGSSAGGTFNASAYTPEGQYDPAFNSGSVYKTQTHEDIRRQNRRAQAMAEIQEHAEMEGNFWARFVIVSSLIVFGVTVASMIGSMASNPKGGLTRGDGSRRNGSRNDSMKR